MRLGLLADIHEHIEHLSAALDNFQKSGVDRIVVLGDVFELGTHLREICCLLADGGAVGVWGNHDYGLCAAPDDMMRSKYGDEVMDYLATFQPRLELAGCLFTHVEPWLDPHKIEDLWYFDGPPDSPEKLGRIFQSGPHRLMFAGHYHRWLLATPETIQDWQGSSPVALSEGRSFVVLGAVCDGRSAIFDTETSLLTPFHLVEALQG